MEFNQYNTTVQQWIHTVLENRETNADVVLECCRDIIAYGRKTDDPKLMGFGFFYGGEIYYELNDGAHFFHMMTEALTYLTVQRNGNLWCVVTIFWESHP